MSLNLDWSLRTAVLYPDNTRLQAVKGRRTARGKPKIPTRTPTSATQQATKCLAPMWDSGTHVLWCQETSWQVCLSLSGCSYRAAHTAIDFPQFWRLRLQGQGAGRFGDCWDLPGSKIAVFCFALTWQRGQESSYKGTNCIHGAPPLCPMNHLPQFPPPNTIPLGFGISFFFLFFFFLIFLKFYWRRVDSQCCHHFCCTTKWSVYTYTHIHSLPDFSPTQPIWGMRLWHR